MHHGFTTGRPAHTLEPAVEENHDEGDGHAGGCPRRKPHDGHAQTGEEQAARQEVFGVGAVGDGRHQKFGNTIGEAGSGADFTQILFVEKTGINQAFLREVKVATSKVIGSIAEEDANEYLPAQAAIGRINFVGRKARNLRRRFEYSNHGCSILLSYDFSCGSPQPSSAHSIKSVWNARK